MKITFVKKILADGSPCKKCADVVQKLEQADQMKFIDSVIIADERDENSPGMKIAKSLNVERAPFFVVEKDNSEPLVYTVYLKFVKEVLNQESSAVDEAKEILANSDDLDFL
ncbi:hypothetical protein NBRC116493_34000 [Aurantivibrio infirmus]